MSTVAWTTAASPDAAQRVSVISKKGASSTGNGDAAPVTASGDGLLLTGIAKISVHCETAGTIPTGQAASLQAYLSNPGNGHTYNRCPRFDFVMDGGGATEAFDGFEVSAEGSYLAYVPSGVSIACNVYINGVTRG